MPTLGRDRYYFCLLKKAYEDAIHFTRVPLVRSQRESVTWTGVSYR